MLEVSWSRAHTLATHAREHLETALDALLIARTGRESCPELAALLADWDGQLTVQAGRLTAKHLEHCETCASRRHGALRPEMLSRLLPLAELPAGLREPILERATASATAASRSRLARLAAALGPRSLRRILGLLSWSKIRAHPGSATAAAAVAVWIVAAVSATMVTVTGLHGVRALAAQNHLASGEPIIPSDSDVAPVSPRGTRSPLPDTRRTPSLLPTFEPLPSVSPTRRRRPSRRHPSQPRPRRRARHRTLPHHRRRPRARGPHRPRPPPRRPRRPPRRPPRRTRPPRNGMRHAGPN